MAKIANPYVFLFSECGFVMNDEVKSKSQFNFSYSLAIHLKFTTNVSHGIQMYHIHVLTHCLDQNKKWNCSLLLYSECSMTLFLYLPINKTEVGTLVSPIVLVCCFSTRLSIRRWKVSLLTTYISWESVTHCICHKNLNSIDNLIQYSHSLVEVWVQYRQSRFIRIRLQRKTHLHTIQTPTVHYQVWALPLNFRSRNHNDTVVIIHDLLFD